MTLHARQFPAEMFVGFGVPNVPPMAINPIALRKNLEQMQSLAPTFIRLNLHAPEYGTEFGQGQPCCSRLLYDINSARGSSHSCPTGWSTAAWPGCWSMGE